MQPLSADQIASFRARGYLIVPGFFRGTAYIDDICAEITALGQVYDAGFALESAVDHVRAFPPRARKSFYDALRYLAALNRLGSCPSLLQTSRDLGQKLPAVMRAYNIRMDLPAEADFLFHWHQDIVYTLGSLNSITYWVPFTPVNRTAGSVAVIPGSHARGVFPVRYTLDGRPPANKVMSPKDLRLLNVPEEEGEVVEADAGDLVVFSTFILHRSVPNRANSIRWTAQMRHADLAEPEFVGSGYLWGDATNVFHAPYLLHRMERAPHRFQIES
jgi:hypothetical protein